MYSGSTPRSEGVISHHQDGKVMTGVLRGNIDLNELEASPHRDGGDLLLVDSILGVLDYMSRRQDMAPIGHNKPRSDGFRVEPLLLQENLNDSRSDQIYGVG